MRLPRCLRNAFAAAAAVCLASAVGGRVVRAQPPASPAASAASVVRNILILDESEPYRPLLLEIVAGVRSVLDTAITPTPSYFIEGLDLGRVGGKARLAESVAWLQRKYDPLGIDLIIALSEEAIDVAQQLRTAWGREVPVVGLLRNTTRPEQIEGLPPIPNGVQMLVGEIDRPVARQMRQLLPGLREVLVVSQDPADAALLAKKIGAELGDRVRVEPVAPPSLTALRARVASLSPDAALFFYTVNRDAEGQTWTSREFLRVLSTTVPRPIFAYVATYLGAGVVGGPFVDLRRIGATMAGAGLRLLRGVPASSIPPVVLSPTYTVYDWTQLERFGIPHDRLDEGATFINRPIPVWEQFPRTTATVSVLLVLLAFSVVLLLRRGRQLQAAHRARTEAAQRLLRVQDTERQRIARDLHDDLCQEMTALALELDRHAPGSDAGYAGDTPAPLQGAAREGAVLPSERVRQLLDRTREIALGLRGVPVRGMPLPDALVALTTNLEQRTGRGFEVVAAGWPGDVSASITEAMYRVVKEALHNAMRHAEATQVVITLDGTMHPPRVTVADDGVGFDASRVSGDGLGLTTMRERMEAVGGRCEVASTPFGGTTVTLVAPAEERA